MGTNSDRFIAKRETELNEQERELVNSWGSEAFGPQEWIGEFSWSTPDWRLFLRENDRPVSHVKLTIRRGRLGADEVLIAGVGGLMTPAVYQGKGFASALLHITQDFIFSEVDADYGLLFCLPELTPFYRRLRWVSVKSPVYIEQPGGRMIWPKAAMVLPGSGKSWNDVEVDVCGNPW